MAQTGVNTILLRAETHVSVFLQRDHPVVVRVVHVEQNCGQTRRCQPRRRRIKLTADTRSGLRTHTSQFLLPDALALLLAHVQRRGPEVGHDHQELLEADLLHRSGVVLVEVPAKSGEAVTHSAERQGSVGRPHLLSKKAWMISERMGLQARSGIALKCSLLRA